MAAIVDGDVRAAIYIHRLAARPTGIQRYTVELANALCGAGRAATIVTGADDGGDAGIVDLQVLPGSAKRRHIGWTSVRRPLFENVAGPYDVAHMSSPAFAVPTRRPLVVTIHDLIPINQPDWYPRGPRWAFQRGVKYAVDHASRFIVPSEFTRQEVLATLAIEPDRIVVIPEGVAAALDHQAPDEAEPADYQERPYLVAVGALSPRKNLDVLIDAIAAVGPDSPRLLIVGEGPERARLQARIDALPDPHAVQLLGHIDDATLQRVLRGALGLLHPALSEGFGLTTIEAMAADVPVIAAATGSLPEVVGDAGVLLSPTDAASWSSAIVRLASDPQWRATLRDRGRARVATYTWDRAAAATYAVYASVAG